MNKYVLAIVGFFAFVCCFAQASFNDSLKQQLAVFKSDSERYVESLARYARLVELNEKTKFKAALLIDEINQLQNAPSSQPQVNTRADQAFAELEEQRIGALLPEKKNQLRQLAGALKRYTNELNLLSGNLPVLKARLMDDKQQVIEAVLENFQQREFKREISFECGSFSKDECQESAREFILRELSEELSGATIESQTLIKNFIIIEDNVKVNTSHSFEEIKVISADFYTVNEEPVLNLELIATVSELATPEELMKLEQALDTRISDFIDQLSES